MSRAVRLAQRRGRFDLPVGVIIGMLVVLALVNVMPEDAPAAVSQIRRVYACMGANGSVTVKPYAPPCRQGQVVQWAVSPYVGPQGP